MNFFPRWGRALLLLALPFAAQAQNVGIGTTAPTQPLDVNGNLRVRGLSGTDTRLLQVDAAGNLSPAATLYPAAGTAAGPLTPAPASTTTGLNNPLVAVSGSLAVVLNRNAGTLSLYDMSNPSAPALRGTATGITNGVEVAVSGTTAAVLCNDTHANGIGLTKLYALGSGAPTLVNTLTPPAALSATNGGIAMTGTRLYAVYDRGGSSGYVYIYDLATPAAATLLGTGNSGCFTPQAVATAGTLVAVSSQYGGVAVLDVSNPAAPVVTGSTGCPAYNGGFDVPVALTTTTLCLLSIPNNSLLTYTLSAAGVPTLRHTYATGATPVSVALSGNLAYVASRGSNSLQVIDVSGASAVLRGTAALDASANNLALGNNLLLAANGSPANDLQAFVLNGPRSVTVAPDGTIGTTALPTSADYVQNQPATTQSGGFNLSNSGYLGSRLGIGTTAPVTRLDARNTGGSAFPATTGAAQSTGHFARFADGSGMVLDLGGNGGSGAWLQSTNVGGLGTNYPLLLNPNGGNVGINTGTTNAGRSLDIGSLSSPRPALLRLGAGNGSGVGRQWELGVQVNLGNLADITGENYDFVLRDATGGNTRLLVEYTTGNVGIGTSSPTQPLDVNGTVRLGTATAPGQVFTPTTGAHNLLAVAYGQVGLGAVVVSTSGNYTVAASGAGVYTVTFPASSGLSAVNFDANPVTVSIYGTSPGVATFTGGAGFITVRTFTLGGVPADFPFTFTAFAP
ncbi:hypothetical protein GCM10022409_36990 [Hymenobacter glaciei]|uniref:DUF4394 domain-containing protein n=2 Tax=Hymenobacter glaciei TaxID=877209 RepID=A0ABP7UM52_9BACT